MEKFEPRVVEGVRAISRALNAKANAEAADRMRNEIVKPTDLMSRGRNHDQSMPDDMGEGYDDDEDPSPRGTGKTRGGTADSEYQRAMRDVDGDDEDSGGDDFEDDDPEVQRAMGVLRRARIPRATMKGMSAEQVLDLADAFRQQQQENTRLAREHRRLAQQQTAPHRETQGEPAGQPTLPDLTALRTKLKDELGDDASGALVGALEAFAQAVQKPQADGALQERVNSLEERNEALVKSERSRVVSEQLDRLAGAYPALKNDRQAMRDLVEAAEELSESERYYDMDRLFDVAAFDVFGPPQRARRRRRVARDSEAASRRREPETAAERAEKRGLDQVKLFLKARRQYPGDTQRIKRFINAGK